MRAAILGKGNCTVLLEKVLPLGIDQLLICAEGGVLRQATEFADRSKIPRLIWKKPGAYERVPVEEMVAFVESAEYILFLYSEEDEQIHRAKERAREIGRRFRVVILDAQGDIKELSI